MKRGVNTVKGAVTILSIIVLLFLCWVLAYTITDAVYSSMRWQPREMVDLMISGTLGLVLFMIGLALIGSLVQQEKHTFMNELIHALRRISTGDYRVNLDLGYARQEKRHQKNPFVKLVNSINDMAANLQAMEAMRQEFISNVSHEIGSPLTSIIGFARALKNGGLTEEQRDRYLDIIETECVRLSRLSDNLLKLAILDSEAHVIQPTVYRLDRQLRSLILANEPQWQAKQLDVDYEAESVEIRADEDLMSQVWMNLLHNAIKFTPDGGRIRISLARQGERAIVRIADSGCGVAEEDLPRIFERFYKADQSRSSSAGGSGLGLSIASTIVGMHQGDVSASSKPGEGTEFTVRLPMSAR
jgi:two-component system, OmpR family, phosphate regulon sensor histidine kinase PhoR